MKLTFEPNLNYQHDAIKSITDIFEGQLSSNSISELLLNESNSINLVQSVGNQLVLSAEQMLENLNKVQLQNEIAVSEALDGMHFSVEMETGTGKTYVYLRTIYELNKLYGFKKFVIVVPSIAIREGVLKNLEITYEHFQTLYDNTSLNYQVYDSSKVSALRGFATNNNIEILVINIDSFAKDENIINKPNDRLSGQKPIEFIQATSPIVIIDEPQNMETEKREKAIENLNPLCTLRYSATHKKQYNLTYSLNPVKAYDLGLVKQIEVDSVFEENAQNDAFVSVHSINATKTKITAKISIHSNENNGVQKKQITVKVGDDLYSLSKQREIYREGYLIEGIDAVEKNIALSSGKMLYVGESQGGLTDEIMKHQLSKTVEEHLSKELKYSKLGIKVLSLIFIDKVANYREYDSFGNSISGKFAKWFEEIYKDFIEKPKFAELNKHSVDDIHNGYFSQDNKGKVKDTSGETKADDDTYNLIMKDKEKLLDINNPLRFIFSHSALREGWDNPNVFQICTLNETISNIKKRQEIGRGLRLAVNQCGQRTYDTNINRLTIIANESYIDFANSLQKEIEEDFGVKFTGRVKNKGNRTPIKYRNGFQADPKFLEIWEKIKSKTTYRVEYKTDELIDISAKSINDMNNKNSIKAPKIKVKKAFMKISSEGIEPKYLLEENKLIEKNWAIPDVLSYIQNKTELTRTTIMQILEKSGRIKEILINPQLFLDFASQEINRSLNQLMINGIKYQKIGDSEYEMRLFEAEELEVYLNNLSFKVSDSSKTIYENFIPLDSSIENQFAKDCESSEQVKFFFKLPNWFKILTPIGNYNPDWALVFEGDKKVYFVAETKDFGNNTAQLQELRASEILKIKCGREHFKEFKNIEYRVISNLSELVE